MKHIITEYSLSLFPNSVQPQRGKGAKTLWTSFPLGNLYTDCLSNWTTGSLLDNLYMNWWWSRSRESSEDIQGQMGCALWTRRWSTQVQAGLHSSKCWVRLGWCSRLGYRIHTLAEGCWRKFLTCMTHSSDYQNRSTWAFHIGYILARRRRANWVHSHQKYC